jgi:GAF domain-containing protein
MYISKSAGTNIPIDACEAERLEVLRGYGVLDTPPEPEFDSIVELARILFETPMASITLVDHDRQWFKARAGIDFAETSREVSFCSHAMENDGIFVVPDAQLDPRFAENPLVTGEPNIRFYAGLALRSPGGHNLGAMCVISPEPRTQFRGADRRKLEILASIASNELELKRQAQQAHQMLEEKAFEMREAHYRIKNTLDYASLLAEVQDANMPTEKLSIIAMAAWKQYTEAGGVLNSCIKSLRSRLAPAEYRKLLGDLPGFAI